MRHEYEREETSATTKLTYLLIGGGIGAILALLFAPKSGQELRGDIADATRKGIEKGREAAAIEAGKEAYAEEKRRTESKSITEGRPTYPKAMGTGNTEAGNADEGNSET